jgi:hypothetical protein
LLHGGLLGPNREVVDSTRIGRPRRRHRVARRLRWLDLRRSSAPGTFGVTGPLEAERKIDCHRACFTDHTTHDRCSGG